MRDEVQPVYLFRYFIVGLKVTGERRGEQGIDIRSDLNWDQNRDKSRKWMGGVTNVTDVAVLMQSTPSVYLEDRYLSSKC